MDWRKGSYIHQYYQNSNRTLLEDIQIFMVDQFFCPSSWYDRLMLLEIKFKLLTESSNYILHISPQERFLLTENVTKDIIKTYNGELRRYNDVESNVRFSIFLHKERLYRSTGYGHYGYKNL